MNYDELSRGYACILKTIQENNNNNNNNNRYNRDIRRCATRKRARIESLEFTASARKANPVWRKALLEEATSIEWKMGLQMQVRISNWRRGSQPHVIAHTDRLEAATSSSFVNLDSLVAIHWKGFHGLTRRNISGAGTTARRSALTIWKIAFGKLIKRVRPFLAAAMTLLLSGPQQRCRQAATVAATLHCW